MSGYEADVSRSAEDSAETTPETPSSHEAVFQVIIVRPDERIAEVPSILSKNVIGRIKTERSQILDEEYCCRSGVALTKHMNLPKPRNENRKLMDDLIHLVIGLQDCIRLFKGYLSLDITDSCLHQII